MLKSGPEKLKAWRERSIQKQRDNPKPRAPIRKVTAKRAKANREYSTARLIHLEAHPFCERCLRDGQQIIATDIHHLAGRDGERLIDSENFLSTCRTCHEWLHAHPQEAKQLGYSRTRHR